MVKLIKLLKPYRTPIIIVFILVFLQSLSELFLPTLMSDIIDIGVVNGDTDYIMRVGGIMILVALAGTIAVVIANYLASKVAVGFAKLLRKKVFTKVEDFSLNEINELGTASLITRTTNDINQIQQVLAIILRLMISAPLIIIGGLVLAVNKNARLSLIFLGSIPFLILGIGLTIRRSIPLFKVVQKKIDNLNLVLREKLTGIRVIRAFNRKEYETKRFDFANQDLTDTSIKVNKIMAGLMPLIMLIMNLTTVAIIWFGSIQVSNAEMQVGDIMAFIQYAMRIMLSLAMTTMMFVLIPRASASADRINEVFETDPEIKDKEILKLADEKHGYVEFKDVTFSYPGAESPALCNIEFSTKPGEITAIIGGTGSGKSTLINLIMRFYDIDSGSILVNGVDIRDMSQEVLRKKIGFVPQKSVLFTGTISENIKYGKENATDEEVKKASDTAQATEFISEMDDKFEHLITQGGSNVSGGQKQRISIARALVRKPEIYIFDDSFSALDFKTDAKLRAALKDETKQATMIMVAQRVSTVMNADRIIVLNQGKIEGIGTHSELLDTNRVYREIVSSQMSEEEISS